MNSNLLNLYNKSLVYFKGHKISSVVLVFLVIYIIYAGFTGTLSYPYIMLDRQIQSLRDCTFGQNDFKTDSYGASFSVSKEYCVLPNRLFPIDGSIEIVPKGAYFVFNEYAKGTVAEASKATLLFEPITSERNPKSIIETLIKGRFLDEKNVSSVKAPSGIMFSLADSAFGTDDKLYDWAFATHPNNKNFVAIVSRHSADKSVRDYLFKTFKFK